MTFKEFISDIEAIPGDIARFFTAHQAALQSAITDAQAAVSSATGVAAILDPQAVPVLSGVADGLTKVSAAVTAASTASTLTSQANTLGTLVSGLVTSGDVGVKNANTKAAIQSAVTKSQAVVGALVTASVVAPVS